MWCNDRGTGMTGEHSVQSTTGGYQAWDICPSTSGYRCWVLSLVPQEPCVIEEKNIFQARGVVTGQLLERGEGGRAAAAAPTITQQQLHTLNVQLWGEHAMSLWYIPPPQNYAVYISATHVDLFINNTHKKAYTKLFPGFCLIRAIPCKSSKALDLHRWGDLVMALIRSKSSIYIGIALNAFFRRKETFLRT